MAHLFWLSASKCVYFPHAPLYSADNIHKLILYRKEMYLLMRSGRNPNRQQKKLLSMNNKNCADWLLIKTIMKENETVYQFVNRNTNEVIDIDEDGNMISE